MNVTDILGWGIFSGLGLWLILFPKGFIRVQSWIYRKPVPITVKQVRNSGIFWIAIVIGVYIDVTFIHRRH